MRERQTDRQTEETNCGFKHLPAKPIKIMDATNRSNRKGNNREVNNYKTKAAASPFWAPQVATGKYIKKTERTFWKWLSWPQASLSPLGTRPAAS